MKDIEKGNIGLAIGLTTTIMKSQLPPDIENNTVFITPNVSTDKNLIENQENLHRITGQIKELIETLSKIEGSINIHLFLAVQSTVALDLSRRYQEGMHKKWIIHNFNGTSGTYKRAIELDNSFIKEH